MIASFTSALLDWAKLVGALGVIGGFVAALSRLRATKWLGRRLISEPLGGWFRGQVYEATSESRHLISYHLGPNGETKPLHQRVSDIERATIRNVDGDPDNLKGQTP